MVCGKKEYCNLLFTVMELGGNPLELVKMLLIILYIKIRQVNSLQSCKVGHLRDDNNEVILSLTFFFQGWFITKRAALR